MAKSIATKPVRVLHAIDHLAAGGIETALMMIYRRINRDKIQYDFLVRKDTPGHYDDEVRSLGGKLICVTGHRNPITYQNKVIRAIEAYGPFAAFHGHLGYYNGFLVGWAASANIPVRIAHAHNILPGAEGLALKKLYHSHMRKNIHRHATHGLAISADAADSLYRSNWRADSRFRTISYGLDLERFKTPIEDRNALRRELGIPADAIVIGHVGRFVRQKNHRFMLEILAELMRRDTGIRAVLVGCGHLDAEIRAQAKALSISDRLVLAGVRSDVPTIMRCVFDLFLFPSLFEGLGLVLIEAQAAGIPCVFSSVVPEEADLIPRLLHRTPLDLPVEKWADIVQEALQSPRPSATEAIAMVEDSSFNLDRVVGFYEHLYQSEGSGTN